MSADYSPNAEWLEADGLGGFASGTVSGVRTRRYHALLLTATEPPTGRFVLVNGFEVWVETPAGRFDISSQRFLPDVTYPDGARRVTSFKTSPWPRWTFSLEDGTVIEQEIFVPHGISAVVVSWRLQSSAKADPESKISLLVRPLLSGRDFHCLHHENAAFRMEAVDLGGPLRFRPYDGVPGVVVRCNASDYAHGPQWYRNFLYEEERARGLDFSEDLASPGTFRFDLSKAEAVWVLSAEGHESALGSGDAPTLVKALRASEIARRGRFTDRLERSGDAYLVRRGGGKTIIAGYPWFTDWGRDTFIALRGLCLATGQLEIARQILVQWADSVSEGMLPNRFPDHGETPEFNAVDASLWFVICVHEYLTAAEVRSGGRAPRGQRRLLQATEAILEGYTKGTRFGIRADDDGLLCAGQSGVQLTWMDARIGDRVVTPRIGKPVEVQALWLNALRIGSPLAPQFEKRFREGTKSFLARFWCEQTAGVFTMS